MAAATILESERVDFHIHLFEKNVSPGKKVIISGGGRCNVTTSIEDKKILAMKYTRGWEFIRKSMGKFSPRKCREWFESHGVPLKIQDDLRVFPVSDDGRDIVGVFEDIFTKNRDRITLHYGEGVTSVIARYEAIQERDSNSPWLTGLPRHHSQNQNDSSQWQNRFLITTPKWTYESDILIITTGWNAYSHTGSTGDGYAFARALGHTITPLWPSLSSFLTEEKWLHELSWLAFEDAKVFLYGHCEEKGESEWNKGRNPPGGRSNPEKKKHGLPHSALLYSQCQNQEIAWPLLLTHFGISWPLTFMASSHLAFEKIEKWSHKIIHFSPLSSMGLVEWEGFLKDQFQSHPKKLIVSILSEKLPRRFSEAFVKEYFPHIEATFAGSIARVDREKISKLLGEWIPLTLLDRRPGDEFVTAWWVNTDELDPETMESRKYKNLYFAGEVLNVDGYTGGFSLQICWASGYVVGKSINNNSTKYE